MVGAIVVRDGIIAKGHGTMAAVRKLYAAGKRLYPPPGRTQGAEPFPDGAVPVLDASGWTDAQFRAFVIADNKLAEAAGWDEELLRLELGDLQGMGFDLDLIGFDAVELGNLLADAAIADEPEQQDAEADDEPDADDDVPGTPVVPVSRPGDVWRLGPHRLMCGDSLSLDHVARLMDGEKADMVFTDPPYNIDYQGVKDKRAKIKNDKMPDEDFVDFLRRAVMPCEVMYVCCSWQYAHLFKRAMTEIGTAPKAMIVWDKVNPAQHLDLYFKQHEIIFYHGPFGGNATVRGDVWQLKRQRNTLHPTMKPVELIEMALGDHPNRKTVYDGFGGSGSTLIACEKTGRHARLMELDPRYCDVIVKRWQEFTGQPARLGESDMTFADIEAARKGSEHGTTAVSTD